MVADSLEVGKGLLRLFDDRTLVGNFHDLRQVGQGHVALNGYVALGGHLLAGDGLEQGRFAGAVLADEGYAVFLVDDE